MSAESLDLVLRLASELPEADIVALAEAASAGRDGLGRLRSRSGSPALRRACEELGAQLDSCAPSFLAGALSGAAAALARGRRDRSIDVVWTGPSSDVDTSRLTAAVVVDLIDAARQELLIVSYATHTEPRIAEAIAGAIARGVDVTLLVERNADNAGFSGLGDAFADLDLRRLTWPAAVRPHGAALHAKLIVVDAEIALVGSANLTGRAMESNLECGILIRGGPQPGAIRDHIWSLVHGGILERATR